MLPTVCMLRWFFDPLTNGMILESWGGGWLVERIGACSRKVILRGRENI